ncbi:hypothetical protein BJY01DRAFT_214638 [Aspergillus pseudoustus]|uniref:ABC transporter permease n=1 Tax=Aspergillus pseudoustus TaxID=1810923 RepID=A0ABR4JXJ5_9EURO
MLGNEIVTCSLGVFVGLIYGALSAELAGRLLRSSDLFSRELSVGVGDWTLPVTSPSAVEMLLLALCPLS